MRAALLTALTMIAFAANSVLNRAALDDLSIDAASFGAIRLVAGALTLAALVLLRDRRLSLGGEGRRAGVLGLLVYIFGFSVAYLALDAGLGALILFGTVQITMFAGALAGGERPPVLRWAGAALACGGLAWLLWPTAGVPVSPLHGAAMACAGVGWGVYSLAGRGATDALGATAANFVLAAPVGLVFAAILTAGTPLILSAEGIALAVLSGALTSGLGYALWYSVLPGLSGSVAAVAQLTVPVIAMAGGMLFLGEAMTTDFVVAAALVLGGLGLAVVAVRR